MSSQANIREQVTNKIVAALRAGTPPWRQPWRSGRTNAGAPANAASGMNYRGVNALLLGLTEYESRWWATYAQIQALGGRVRKGERATRIVYWREVERVVATAADGSEAVETFPLLKTYSVFNAAQVDGLEQFQARSRPVVTFEDFGPFEAVVAATGADIRHGGDRAFYHPARDFIQVPPRESFEGRAAYSGTLAHEMCHWTGHAGRLDRLAKNARFGDRQHSVEELVAEIGGAFLCTAVGVSQSDDLSNQAAYVASWLAVLERDATAIFTAAGQASRAVDYILSFSRSAAGERHGAVTVGVAA